MVEASVGFQCPECSRRGQTGARTARTRTGARIGAAGSNPLSTYSAAAILVGIKVIVGLANLVSGGVTEQLLYSLNLLVAQGQVWRLVTHVFTSGGLLNLLINAVFLFFICRQIEAEIGRWRIIAAFLLAGFGSAAVVFALGPATAGVGGGLTAVLGLLGMNAALKARRSEDIKPDLIFLGILVAFNLFLGFVNPGGLASQLLAIFGGVGFGAGIGLVLAWGPREGRTRRQVGGLAGLAALGIVLVAGRLLVGLV